MNLDETIVHAKELSEDQTRGELFRENQKQLAAWLEELKQYKEENQPGKTVIEKEKPAREEIKLFSIEVVLTPDTDDHMHLETNICGHRAEVQAFLETMDADPEEYRSILKSAARAMLRDFIQQVVNSSESLEGAEMEEVED